MSDGGLEGGFEWVSGWGGGADGGLEGGEGVEQRLDGAAPRGAARCCTMLLVLVLASLSVLPLLLRLLLS